MKIKSIDIESFKSIKKARIELNHNCIGLVGVNESGKTNVLDALSRIDINKKLTANDKTKDSEAYSSITFSIELNEKEQEEIKSQIIEYANQKTIEYEPQFEKNIAISYRVFFDGENEVREFNISGVKTPTKHYYLKDDYLDNGYKIQIGDEYFDLIDFYVVKKQLLDKEEKNIKTNEQLKHLSIRIENIISEISEVEKPEEKQELEEATTGEEEDITINEKLTKLNKEKDELIENKDKLLSKVSFNLVDFEEELNNKLDTEQTKFATYEEKVELLKKEIVTLNEVEIDSITKLKKTLKTNQGAANNIESKIKKLNEKLDALYNRSLFENYTQDSAVFFDDLLGGLNLHKYIPKVIFWENNQKYILPSSIQFDELIEIEEEEDIPRPLINIFRIGMKISTLEEFKATLNDLMENGSKRSSVNAKLNEKVNRHIKEVWGEYDQEMKISVEQMQIRIEIFDPKRDSDAEFFELQERSQGCKSFLSFILTIGAESKTNIINNHLLLLDEPESHLHPSGQRFMLKELRNISKANQVVYATHSNHMIIRDNYDQHLIIEKEKMPLE